jgi:hypothetical protein
MDDEAHTEAELHDGSTDGVGRGEEYVPHPQLLERHAQCLPGLQA